MTAHYDTVHAAALTPMHALDEHAQPAVRLHGAAGSKRNSEARGALRQVVVHLRRQQGFSQGAASPVRDTKTTLV